MEMGFIMKREKNWEIQYGALQKAIDNTAINYFWYYPKENLNIMSEKSCREYKCKSRYEGAPESFAKDFILPWEMDSFYHMCEKIKMGAETATEVFHRPDGVSTYRVTLTTVETDGEGEPQEVIGVIENDCLKQQMNIIEVLGEIYESNYYVDLRTKKFQEVRSNGYARKAIGRVGDVLEAVKTYCENLVEDTYYDIMKAFMDIETLPERLMETKSICVEYLSKTRKWYRASFIVAKRDEKGVPIEAMFAIENIDELKKKELDTQFALREAYGAACRANHAKSDFLSKMSHDIRTPMNAIIGMTAIAGAHIDEKDRVVDCLNKITTSSKHLLGLINEVLDMSKIEAGKLNLNEEEFNLAQLIDNLLEMVRTQVKAKRHHLKVRVHDIRHENVIGDSLRIQQVFVNLMSNAIKYTPEGGTIFLEITEKKSEQSKLGRYEIVFADTGIGMSKEFVEQIFEPFAREEDSRVDKIQGTGLGMTITKSIITMMGGDIKVESVLGKGSKFIVTIFLKLQDEEAVNIDEFKQLPVLVVDDDEDTCESTCLALHELGMRGHYVLSGEEAIEEIISAHERGEDYFSVIIDWKMPGMDGLQTTKEIRKRAGENMPIVTFSAYDWTDIELEARAAGADAFISKPMFKSKLAVAFKDIVSRGKETEELDNPMAFPVEDFSDKRILIVEDNEINCEIVKEILGMTGVEMEVAVNGKEAVNIFQASEPNHFNLIFMDIQMPIMNGNQATMAIRSLNRRDAKSVPIVAMTANAFAEDVEAALSAGMNEHLAKPVEVQKLMETMKKWLR